MAVKTSDGGTFEPVLGPKAQLLSAHTRAEIDHEIGKFPAGRQRSASLAALRSAQEQGNGYLTVELMDAVAEYLALQPIQVYEVASFYSMFVTRPCGRHHVSICTNVSCMLNGADDLVARRDAVTVGEEIALREVQIGATDPARADPDPHLMRPGFRHRPLDLDERPRRRDGTGAVDHPRSHRRRHGLNLRSRRLLETTNTDENAIAAPASIGLSSPAAASGSAATL